MYCLVNKEQTSVKSQNVKKKKKKREDHFKKNEMLCIVQDRQHIFTPD
jgi:ATP-dependent protease HslVU (ClpYQ) peptidase subunit